jgi:hypothetical protein
MKNKPLNVSNNFFDKLHLDEIGVEGGYNKAIFKEETVFTNLKTYFNENKSTIKSFTQFVNENSYDFDKQEIRNIICSILYNKFDKISYIEDLEDEQDLEKFCELLANKLQEDYNMIFDYVKSVHDGTWDLFTLTCALTGG